MSHRRMWPMDSLKQSKSLHILLLKEGIFDNHAIHLLIRDHAIENTANRTTEKPLYILR